MSDKQGRAQRRLAERRANADKVHKQVIHDWLSKLADDYPKMTTEGVIACFEEEFDYYPEEFDKGDLTVRRRGLYRRDAGETSKQAAIDVTPRTGTQRYKVLEHIYETGAWGLTRDEIAQRLQMSPNTVRPRVKELIDGGFVTESRRQGGELAKRKTHSGKWATILVVTALGDNIITSGYDAAQDD